MNIMFLVTSGNFVSFEFCCPFISFLVSATNGILELRFMLYSKCYFYSKSSGSFICVGGFSQIYWPAGFNILFKSNCKSILYLLVTFLYLGCITTVFFSF